MINDPVLVDDWHPVCQSTDVTEGGLFSVRLLQADLVLWRQHGQIMAWQDLCLHRGARLSRGRVGAQGLACPYHGWVYNSAGRCIHIPAHPDQTPPIKAQVRTYQTRERYKLVWVCLGEPAYDLPAFPEEGIQGYRTILSGPFGPVNAGAPRIIENFLDVAHFPFVHGGSLGAPERPEIADYTVETGPDGVVARDVAVYQPDPYGTGVGDTVTYTYRVLRPFTAYLSKATPKGTRLSILFPLTPHDEGHTSAWFYMAMSANEALTDAEVDQFHSSILVQDVPIVESQRPELLPLDLQAELHLRSDRTAIAYRRWLTQLGLAFGTA